MSFLLDICRKPSGNRQEIDRKSRWGTAFGVLRVPDDLATPGGGPLLVSLGCQTMRPPQVGDQFWCPQGAGRSVHPRWGTAFGVLRVPDEASTPGGGPLLVSSGCQTGQIAQGDGKGERGNKGHVEGDSNGKGERGD